MTRPLFSLLHSSWGRPAKAIAAMSMWFDRASQPDEIEYIMAVNEDDPTVHELLRHPEVHRRRVTAVMQASRGSASAWDAAARNCTGQILVQVSDDVEPPQDWDRSLSECFHAGRIGDWAAFARTSDGYRNDALMVTAICNRSYYTMQGEFLHAGYQSVFSDDEYSCRAYAAADEGRAVCVDARDLVFLHRHAYHDKTVPLDATYSRQNSAEAYARGSELFMHRNAELVKRGFKTW